MKSIKETIKDVKQRNLKPIFYFTNADFFDIITDKEEKQISATYAVINGNRYVYFYNDNQQIGFLKLKPKVKKFL